MSYLRLAPEAYDKLLEQDLKTAQMNICDYISYLRKQKTAAHKLVGVYVAAIRKFYSMNDVQLNWDKIHSFEGDDERQTEDRPYSEEYMQQHDGGDRAEYLQEMEHSDPWFMYHR